MLKEFERAGSGFAEIMTCRGLPPFPHLTTKIPDSFRPEKSPQPRAAISATRSPEPKAISSTTCSSIRLRFLRGTCLVRLFAHCRSNRSSSLPSTRAGEIAHFFPSVILLAHNTPPLSFSEFSGIYELSASSTEEMVKRRGESRLHGSHNSLGLAV